LISLLGEIRNRKAA
jgi:hypothetical protein